MVSLSVLSPLPKFTRESITVWTKHNEAIFRSFLHGVSVLGINRPIARLFAIIRGNLREQGQVIPQPDIFIGATAIHYDLTLVTRNLKDVQRIPNLKLYRLS